MHLTRRKPPIIVAAERVALPLAFCVLMPLLLVLYLQQNRNDRQLRDVSYANQVAARQATVASCLRGSTIRRELRATQAVLVDGVETSLPAFEAQTKLLASRLRVGTVLTPSVRRNTRLTLRAYRKAIRSFRSFLRQPLIVTHVDCQHAIPPVVRANIP